MHSEIHLLTSYSFEGIIYAYYAWYTSRITFLQVTDSQDGVPVSSLLETRKNAFEYMKQIYESGTNGYVPKSEIGN
jgi:hypothetical protein